MVNRVTEVATRLSVENAARAGADMRRFGQTGRQAMDDLARATRAPSRELLALDAASGRAQQGMRALGDTAAIITGPLGGVASRISGIVTLFGRVGPAGLGAAAVIGGLSLATVKAVSAAESFERQQLRTEAVLNATNFAAGRTEKQIDRLTFSIADLTLASRQGARESASALLTFRSISGDVFDRTLRLSQDLAEVFGGDLRSSTVQLAKALEDPVRGLTALRRIGVSFTDDQKEMIKQLVEANKQVEAQGKLLNTLENQIGGAGQGAAEGLSGAFDSLVENTNRFWVNIGENIGLLDRLTAGMKVLADLSREGADIQEVTPGGRIAELAGDVERTRSRLQGEAFGAEPTEPGAVIADSIGSIGASGQIVSAAESNIAARALRRIEPRLAAQEAELRELQAEVRRESLASVRAGQTAARLRQVAADEREAKELRDRGEKRLGFGPPVAAEQARLRALEATAEGLRESFDGLTVEMGKQLVADEKRKKNLEDLIEGAEQQAKLAGLTVEEREAELAVLRAQKVAGDGLTETDEARLRAAIATRQAQERASEEAQRQADETRRVWETAAEDIQSSLVDAIVGGPGQAVESLKRVVANFVTGVVFQPGGLLSGFNPTAPGGTAAAAAGGGGFNLAGLFTGGGFSLGGGVGNLSTLGNKIAGLFGGDLTGGAIGGLPTNALLGGGAAFLAPVALSLLSGQNVPQALTSGLGSVAGFALGGPIGAAAGGFLGNLLGGSLFGGDKEKPRASGLVGFRDGELAVLRAQRQDGGDEQSGRDLAQATVDALKDFADLAGAGFDTAFSGARGAGTLGLIQVKQTDDGPRFRFRRGLTPGGELGSFRTAEAAIDAFIGDAAAAGVLTGLPKAIADVAGEEGAGEAARLLGVRRSVGDRIDALDGKGLRTALRDVGEAFEDLTEDAEKAGIDLRKIERLKQADIIGIVARASDEQIAAVGRIADPSTRRAFDLGRRARSVLTGADDLSRRFAATAQLSAFSDVLRFGAASPFSAADQLATARQRFNATANRARRGDLDALESLPGLQSRLLQLSETVHGRTGAFAVDFRNVTRLNEQLGAFGSAETAQTLQRQANESLAALVTAVGTNGANATELRNVRAELAELSRSIDGTLGDRIERLVDKIAELQRRTG